jgi:hypothetical protein
LRARGASRGQVLVIVALGITALFAFAGLAFDIGRFYSERRFLQNAADAAALAAATALIRGESDADADAEARDVLTRNFVGSPNGSSPSLPSVTPVYDTGYPGWPEHLQNGILIDTNEVRVAIESQVDYTFGRAVGLSQNRIGVSARAKLIGDLVPIAARHYVNAPGPWTGAAYPCGNDQSRFMDLIATVDTACLGTETDASLRVTPSLGMDFDALNPNNDTAHHGPIVALVGEGASPSNAADFRGFVNLDIRNFDNDSSNLFYNGVTSADRENELKDFEAAWVVTGYPGPDFPVVSMPPDPNDQVAILSGNSAGVVIDTMSKRYLPGDEVLVLVYSGTVMTIPDFAYSVANTVSIGTTQNRDGAVSMSATKNKSFAGTVQTTAFKDWGDSFNPYGGTLAPLTFTPDPLTPPTTVTWATFNTTAAPAGIYTVWIQAHSPSPYLKDHYYPVAINVGSVTRDFTTSSSNLVIQAAATGDTATGSMTFGTTSNSSTAFGGTVNLTVEGGPALNGVLPTGIGAISVTPSSFVLNRSGSQTVSLTINTGSLAPGQYPLTVRATGTNQDGKRVTRLIPVSVTVATGTTSNAYIDILGFTVFRISSVDSNTIYGYAVSGVYADQNDPELRRGQVARLVPWTD